MLYSQPNEITKEKFLAWARTRSGEYNYLVPGGCALAQYLQAQHPNAYWVSVGGYRYTIVPVKDGYLLEHKIPHWLVNALRSETFEQLVEKLEAEK